jgi:hypothetical protein
MQTIAICELLVQRTEQQEMRGVYTMQQHEQLPHYLLPGLLLKLAAELITQPAVQQYPALQHCVQASALALALSRGEHMGMQTSHPVPAVLQQVLLQDLLPMVVQIGSSVLALPGPAAYRGYGSGSTQSSIPAAVTSGLSDFLKLNIALCMMQCINCAAYPSRDSRIAAVRAATLGAHVLPIAQLSEAAVRRSQQLSQPMYDNPSMDTLSGLCWYLRTLCCSCDAVPGALLHVASSAAAADAAGVSAQHAQVQFASLCCSIMKAAAASAAMPGVASRDVDATYLLVASALSSATTGPWCNNLSASWQAEFTAASGVAWLAISGRVMLYLAARLEYAAATVDATAGSNTAEAGASAANTQVTESPALGAMQDDEAGLSRSALQDLQTECLVLCRNLLDLLRFAPASQQLSVAGYSVLSLQQQLNAFLQPLPRGVQSVSLGGEQVAGLRSLGLALTTLAFPCACNNPACS